MPIENPGINLCYFTCQFNKHLLTIYSFSKTLQFSEDTKMNKVEGLYFRSFHSIKA